MAGSSRRFAAKVSCRASPYVSRSTISPPPRGPNGLLVIPAAENVARLLPPLIIGEEEIFEAVARFDAACQRIESGKPETSSAKLSGTAG